MTTSSHVAKKTQYSRDLLQVLYNFVNDKLSLYKIKHKIIMVYFALVSHIYAFLFKGISSYHK